MRKYLIPWWKTNLGKNEARKIEESIIGKHITQGYVTEKLEKYLARLLDVPYAVLTTSGSTALLMALLACEIKPGDEVVVPNLTFAATVQAPLLLGAKVKFVDVECRRPLIDIKLIEKVVSPKTKVIIPVHLNGRAAKIEHINRLALKYNIRVIEDAAQALCSRNSSGYLGTQSEMGVFSLSITKLITTVQGGLLVTRKKALFERIKKIRNYGMPFRPSCKSIYDIMGFNFKFNDILASVGLSQAERINEKISTLKDIYNFYKEELEVLDYIKIIDVDIGKGELPLWIEVLCSERNKVIALLREENIQAKAFDPVLCDLFSAGKNKNFKYSRIYAQHGLILPCGPDQSRGNLRRVAKALRDIRSKIKSLCFNWDRSNK